MSDTEDILKQQAAEQAPPVNPTIDISPILEDVKKTATETEILLDQQEKILADGIESEFWLIIKDRLTKRITSLRSAQSLRLGNGPMDLQNIGLRAVIINEIADGFQDVINMVELPSKKKQAQISDAENEVI